MTKVNNVADFLLNYKESVAIESFQLATSLSPGTALQAVVESNHSNYSNLKRLADKTSTVSLPLPHEKAFIPTKTEDSTKPIHSSNIINEDDSIESLENSKKNHLKAQTLKDKIKNAKPKIPIQKKPKEKVVDPDVLIQIEKEKKRADAIIKILDLKRIEYHEQAKRDAFEHLEASKKKVAELDALHVKALESKSHQNYHKVYFKCNQSDF